MIRLYKTSEPPTPPTERVMLFCDASDGNFKMKREDGSIVTFGGTGVNKETHVEYITLDAGQISAGEVILANAPSPANQTTLDIINGGPQFYGDDFTVTGNVLSWLGKPIDGVLSVGNRIRVQYLK